MSDVSDTPSGIHDASVGSAGSSRQPRNLTDIERQKTMLKIKAYIDDYGNAKKLRA